LLAAQCAGEKAGGTDKGAWAVARKRERERAREAKANGEVVGDGTREDSKWWVR
jgi:hypothetical protein